MAGTPDRLVEDVAGSGGGGGGGSGGTVDQGAAGSDPWLVEVQGGVQLDAGDIEIGAVEIKNASDDTRATVDADGLAVKDGQANTKLGALNEAAPGTDTASSGLNGRLQRIAQRLTSLIALLPGSLGQKARAASLAITISTEDQVTQDAIATSLAIMDDWDESDRAKANIIVGQAGITAGAGAVAANTPRVTHASDDPAVTALQIMDDWDEADRAKVNPIAGQAGVQGGSGTSNALTQRVVQATDVPVPSLQVTGRVFDATDGTTVVVKYANGVATASGDNVVLAAVTGKKIRVLGSEWHCLEAGTVVTAQYQDNGTATARGVRRNLFASADGTSSQGDVKAVNPLGYFETAEGVGLDLNLSAAIDVAWAIVYVEVE